MVRRLGQTFIEYGHHEIEESLLVRGAQVDVCVAAIKGRLDEVRRILDRSPALVNDHSTHISPLAWASFGNQVEVAEELVRR